jgi:hypothetical protein
MNALVYNASIAAGIALVGGGVALVSVPGALVAVGALVLAFTVFGALISTRGR